jgi:hypothetical protein
MKIRDHGSLAAMAAAARQDPAEKIAAGRISELFELLLSILVSRLQGAGAKIGDLMATQEYQQIKESMKSAFLFLQILDSKEAAQGFRCPKPAAADARQPRKNRKATVIRHRFPMPIPAASLISPCLPNQGSSHLTSRIPAPKWAVWNIPILYPSKFKVENPEFLGTERSCKNGFHFRNGAV